MSQESCNGEQENKYRIGNYQLHLTPSVEITDRIKQRHEPMKTDRPAIQYEFYRYRPKTKDVIKGWLLWPFYELYFLALRIKDFFSNPLLRALILFPILAFVLYVGVLLGGEYFLGWTFHFLFKYTSDFGLLCLIGILVIVDCLILWLYAILWRYSS